MTSSVNEERERIEDSLTALAYMVNREELTIEQATNQIRKYSLNSEIILAAATRAEELTKSNIQLAHILAFLAHEAGRALDDEKDQAVTALSLADVLNVVGMYSDALQLLLRECLVVFQKTGASELEAATLHCLGNVYENTGDYETARHYFEQSLGLSKDLGLERLNCLCLGGLGIICTVIGDFDTARSHFEQALDQIDDRLNEGRILGNLGIVCRHISDYDKAIQCHERALMIARECEDKDGEALQLNNLGSVHENLNEYAKAWEYFHQAVELSQRVGNKQSEARSLANLGQLSRLAKDDDRAIRFITQALRHNQETRDRRAEGIQSGSLGSVYLELNDHERAAYYANRALLVGKEIGDRHLEAASNALLGHVRKAAGNHQEAEKCYLRSLDLHRELADIDGELGIHACLGRLYESHFNDNAMAFDSFKRSISLFDQIRTSLIREEHKISFGGGGVNVFEELISLCLRMQKDAEAFEYSERARSRAFLDQLGHSDIRPPKNIDPQLLAKEKELISVIRKTSIALRNAETDEQRHIHLARIAAAQEGLDLVLGEMEKGAPEYVALRRSSPLTLAEVKACLRIE